MNPFQSVTQSINPSTFGNDSLILFPHGKTPRPQEAALVETRNVEPAGGAKTPSTAPLSDAVPNQTAAPVTPQSNVPLVPANSTSKSHLVGGCYDPANALALLNLNFFVAKVSGAYPIAQVEDDGSVTYIPSKDFSLKLANLSVRVDDGRGGKKLAKAEQFWVSHPHREERHVIFDPKAPAGMAVRGKYNLWAGFAVTPRRVTGKQRRLLRHLFEVICRKDKTAFRYLLFWLAWAVQNPDKSPETAIVLKSACQGTGKTTLNAWMCRIFGNHSRIISDKNRLFDRFNSNLETAVFLDADEMLWAGDRGTADQLKSLITGSTITLEVKHGARWSVPNRLHIIMTTNHEHAVQAGVQDRRFFVLDVSTHKAQDRSWFDPLYSDLESGGPEELLWVLQKMKLGNWHPRQLPKTSESIEQQRLSADSISQWSQACIEADGIVSGAWKGTHPLGQLSPSHFLYEAYKGFCKQYPATNGAFGKALTQMFGPPNRQSVGTAGVGTSSTTRPRTYAVPDADDWQLALDRRLGIAATN
jgi:hypothetical protein